MSATRCIVVGVDGSPAGAAALRWALAESELRGEPVRALHAWSPPLDTLPDAPIFGSQPVETAPAQVLEFERLAVQRLDEALAEVEGTVGVERRTVQGQPADVLIEASCEAELLVVGSHGHGLLAGVLLGSVSQACANHARCPVVVVRAPETSEDCAPSWAPDEVVARELEQNASTWEALQRLGVREGRALELEFVYESGGSESDAELAEHLRASSGYRVEVEPGGVSGSTGPFALSLPALELWVRRMVLAGYDHGGCVFDGWTATVPAGDPLDAAAENRLRSVS